MKYIGIKRLTNRQKGRQIKRQTDRQTDRQIERQTDKVHNRGAPLLKNQNEHYSVMY